MARHRMPVARAPFWSTALAGTAAAAIVSGTWGMTHPVTVQGTAHMSWDGKAQVAGCADLTAPGTAVRALCMGVPVAAAQEARAHDYGICSYVGHTCYSNVTGRNLDRDEAARAIGYAIQSGQGMYEDWSWDGMPAVVGEYSADLMDQWVALGQPEPVAWLLAGADGPGDGDETQVV